MAQELVSIITPACNDARFIEATVESVLAQTYPSWELLIVDDGSTDNTRELLDPLAARDARVKPIAHALHGGPARARNAALEAAGGDLIAFLDSGDLWLPQKLERQIAFMKRKSSAFSFTGYRRIDESGENVGELHSVPRRLNYSELLKNTAITTSTVLIDRRITGNFSMPITHHDDFAAWLSLLRKGYVAHGLREDLVRHRTVSRSVSRDAFHSARMVWRAYRDIERLARPQACWCFANYAFHAWMKYRRF